LCVDTSEDVLAYLRELLRQAGYDVLTSGNLPDAMTLLTAALPKVVVIGSDLRAARQTRAGEAFNRRADGLSVIELPPDFGGREAGDAGEALLHQVRTIMGPAEDRATVSRR